MGKLSTPDWIKEGYDSKLDWEKAHGGGSSGKESGKSFKIKVCPKCRSENVKVVIDGKEGSGAKDWECKSCSWTGKAVKEKEVTEEEFLEHLDKMEGESNGRKRN